MRLIVVVFLTAGGVTGSCIPWSERTRIAGSDYGAMIATLIAAMALFGFGYSRTGMHRTFAGFGRKDWIIACVLLYLVGLGMVAYIES